MSVTALKVVDATPPLPKAAPAIPALDGGRLMFLGFEAAARRKPDAKLEARIHAVGLLMMLALIAVVTVGEVMPKK